MPIYTYRCENCGVQFERKQKFADAPLKRCPECSKKSLRKVYTPVGIVFKGSGFYATDHRSPSGTRSHAEHGNHTEKKSSEGDSNSKASTEKSSGSKEKSASSTENKSKS